MTARKEKRKPKTRKAGKRKSAYWNKKAGEAEGLLGGCTGASALGGERADSCPHPGRRGWAPTQR